MLAHGVFHQIIKHGHHFFRDDLHPSGTLRQMLCQSIRKRDEKDRDHKQRDRRLRDPDSAENRNFIIYFRTVYRNIHKNPFLMLFSYGKLLSPSESVGKAPAE